MTHSDGWKLLCRDHNTITELFCCDQFICVYCRRRKHKGHHCESLPEQAKRIRELSHNLDRVERRMFNALSNFEVTTSEFKSIKLTLMNTLKSRIVDYIMEQLKLAEQEATNILIEYDRVVEEHLKLYKDVFPSKYLRNVFEKTDFELILEKERIIGNLRGFNDTIPSLAIGLTERNYPNMLGSLDVHVDVTKDFGSPFFSQNAKLSNASDDKTLVKKLEDLLEEG